MSKQDGGPAFPQVKRASGAWNAREGNSMSDLADALSAELERIQRKAQEIGYEHAFDFPRLAAHIHRAAERVQELEVEKQALWDELRVALAEIEQHLLDRVAAAERVRELEAFARKFDEVMAGTFPAGPTTLKEGYSFRELWDEARRLLEKEHKQGREED